MSLFEAIIMGFIQGVTEFLPVSSSGHLAIFKNIFKINTDTGMLFDILLHFGTLVAIFVVYFKDIKELIVEGVSIVGLWFSNIYIFFRRLIYKENREYKKVITTPYRRFVMFIILSTAVTGVLAIIFKDVVEDAGETLLVPGICLLITGLVLLLSDMAGSGKKNEESVTYRDSAIVGLVQGVATLPGISRSGSTITAGLLCGFDKAFAVKYSFIMSIPAILGAVVLELKDATKMSLSGGTVFNYVIGMIIAAVVGYICIKTMLVIVKKSKFKYFAYYCFGAGAVSIIYYIAS